MKENRILIDSNSYFRLAQSLHPLLNNPFDNEKYNIFIISECEKEYLKSSSLQNKFPWVNQNEYVENRKNIIKISSSSLNGINNSLNFIKLFAREKYLLVSKVDLKYLAVALELDMILVTDDGAMIEIANDFEINVLKTLELLKLMLDCKFISIGKVKEIINLWKYNNDLPKDFFVDLKKLFKL